MEAHNSAIDQLNHELDRLKELLRPPPPQAPPNTSRIISPEAKIHAKFRNMKNIRGFGPYVDACNEQARIHGLNFSSNYIRSIAAMLWSKEPSFIRDVYITAARDASVVIRKHKTQFLSEAEHHCSEICDNCH
ncbi:unnamed protein product [Rhizophagus irregularis]|nr:unnamed protein product [Rhizophagus irregularis]CAB5384499.1 unnamed protein product [Rhizophagus irregularis]